MIVSKDVPTSSSSNGELAEEKLRGLHSSASYVLVYCHLEMLRHSLSPQLHLTQVVLSLAGFYTFHFKVGSHILLKWDIFKQQNLSSRGATWWENNHDTKSFIICL